MAIGDYMMSDSKQISFGFDCSYSLRSVDFIKSGYLMNYLGNLCISIIFRVVFDTCSTCLASVLYKLSCILCTEIMY